MQVILFFVVATLCLSLTYSVKIGKFEPRCPPGSFRNAVSGLCQVCTQPCPSPLVEISACRHDADAVCGAPDAHADVDAADVIIVDNKPRPIKSCSADSFFNRGTGLCQECIRFCAPPLVMTEPCRRKSDAVCGRPRQAAGKTSSRRRKDKHERKRRRKTRKKPKKRPSPQTTSNTATSDQLCSENREQFYDSTQGRCLQCRSCDGALEEISPCTSTSDRVCSPKHGPASTKAPQTGSSATELQSNELPKDGHTKSEMSNRSRNNEYPDSRADSGSDKHPGKTDTLRGNSADNQDHVSADPIHSNIAE
ncbi:uncharacterized protein LOC119725743 [Patiria miniata]|uniref:TNFR-Cys domain-containing protein n=1 Tax=Patiria miniata TaxID=46514 RepID=A0A913ZN56_PATMI|nr:uncharacterized protein LOC119725743 [Patiria miniata]